MVVVLLKKGADLMARNKVRYAVTRSHERVAELLLQNGADLMAQNKVGKGGGGGIKAPCAHLNCSAVYY
jgi:hypothetical protein